MNPIPTGIPCLTELDHLRLRRLIGEGSDHPVADLLAGADTLPGREIPPDVVTMYSQVLLRPLAGGAALRVTLCYPRDAEPTAGFVSILSPLGTALLGHAVGDVIDWATPGGEVRQARIEEIGFQPEASGDYTL